LKNICAFRMGHRKGRDPRISTHVALTARAFGANGMFFSGDKDPKFEESVRKVISNWGGEFTIEYVKSWKAFLSNWRLTGKLVHLTMYGLNLHDVIEEIRSCDKELLIIVGGQKVPGELYSLADWNVSITNQPHSEVSALAVFLHELLQGDEFKKEYPGAKISILPRARGKEVIKKDT